MKNIRMAALIFGVTVGLGTLAVSAQAQDRDDYGPQASAGPVLAQWGYGGGYDDGHFNHGYRDGMNAGSKDAWKGIRPIPYEHGAFRGSHNDAYREGYLRGYHEGYEHNARGWRGDGYRNDHWRERDDHDRDDYYRDRDWRDR